MLNPKLFLRSFLIKEKDFVVAKNSNLFIGGITGRTGTSWLMRVLRTILKNKYVLIGEHGSFVLSQFRNAGYEFYQGTPGTIKNRKYYLKYFHEFMTHKAYNRREIYGEGLKGFCGILPRRAVRLAFNALKNDLENAQSLQECNVCFGNFYSRLLNIHSLLRGADSLNWISKEPSYARHIKDLYDMIPDCRVVVMVRDGRDTALSMAKKKGWHNGDIIGCIDRWRDFTKMTLDALEHVPPDNYLLLQYEQLLLDFKECVHRVFKFYGIEISNDIIENIDVASLKHSPIRNNFNKWKKELNQQEINYFHGNCQDLMERLGYKL